MYICTFIYLYTHIYIYINNHFGPEHALDVSPNKTHTLRPYDNRKHQAWVSDQKRQLLEVVIYICVYICLYMHMHTHIYMYIYLSI